MTREEAIEILRYQRFVVDFQTEKALEMAISALRQQEHFCEVTKKLEPLTNAQKIRSMSDEELAECLFQIGYDNGWGMKEYALEWLQQPCEGGE